MKTTSRYESNNVIIHIIFILLSISFIVPFLYLISISLASESDIVSSGYRLIPKQVSFDAYNIIFANHKQIVDSYITTILFSSVGTFLSVLIMALAAYPLSRENFKYRKPVTFYIFFTMLFGGGLVPSYILNTQYLHLGDTLMIYILTGLASAWYIIIIRTFFQGLPVSLIESAKIDGARELTIFNRIILPLSKPVLATIALFVLLTRWNDWFTSMIYIKSPRLYSLQYLLQRILREAEFVKSMSADIPAGIDVSQNIPTDGMRFAMVILAAGPMLVIFPFFQKYFTKGLTIGAVKG